MAARLVDDNGQVKPFSQWVKDVQPIASHYNRDWLQTEYSTAIMRARQAAQWRKYERDADLFPNLKWLPSTSIEKREGHTPFYGLVKPIDDPFWKQHYPGNLWNCKCGITNTDDKPSGHIPAAPYKPAPGLDANPATGQLFNVNTHPYKTKAYEGADKAVENKEKDINKKLLIRVENVLKSWKKKIPEHTGLEIKSDKLITGSIRLLRTAIKDTRAHSSNWKVLLYLTKISKDIDTWHYLGWSEIKLYPKNHKLAGKKKHPEAYCFLYYKAKIGGVEHFVNVKLHKDLKSEVYYCITDRIDDINEGIPIKYIAEIKK